MTNLPRNTSGHPITGSDHAADIRLLVEVASDGATTGGFSTPDDWTPFDDIVAGVDEDAAHGG